MKTPSLLCLCLAGMATAASASGYHFGVQSVSAQGTANAAGAEAADASGLFFNPAVSSLLDGSRLSAALVGVAPHVTISDARATDAQGHAVKSGSVPGSPTELVLVPQLFASHAIDERWSLGLGLFVPFGDRLRYNDNWYGRYNATELDMMTLAINPSVAFRPVRTLAVGVGLTAQYMDATYQKQVDFGSLINEGLLAKGLPALVDPSRNANPLYDGTIRYNGTAWGYGYNAGILWMPAESTRVGLAYRSSIRQSLEGTAEWSMGPGSKAMAAASLQKQGFVSGPAYATLRTPDAWSVNLWQQLDARNAVMADWTLTRHSRFDALRLKFSTGLPDAVIRQDWKDSQRYSLGLSHRVDDALVLRAGVAYDQSPVPSSGLRIAGLPDGDRYWLSLGAGIRVARDATVDLAYSLVDVKEVDVDSTECAYPACTGSGTTTHARYKSVAHLVGVQYNQRF